MKNSYVQTEQHIGYVTDFFYIEWCTNNNERKNTRLLEK